MIAIVLQCLALALVIAAVAWLSIPAALIVTGLFAVIVIEALSRRKR